MLDSSELLILAQLLNNILKKQKDEKLKLLIVGIILLLSSSASAQVSVNLNIGTESSWHHMNLGKIMDILILLPTGH
jgi:hypothetical protein